MKYYLTTPIYYVNAAPHLGTAYSTFVADLIKRFKKMEGYDPVVLTTGSDEHSLQSGARRESRRAQSGGVHARRWRRSSSSQWAKLGIDYDHFIRTSDPKHHETVRWLFERCQKNGYIYKGAYTGAYCVNDEAYVNDVKPGDPCPDVRPSHRNRHGRELFLQAVGVSEAAAGAVRTRIPEFVKPDHRRNEMIAFVQQGLNDLSITRTNIQWGIPAPVAGHTSSTCGSMR